MKSYASSTHEKRCERSDICRDRKERKGALLEKVRDSRQLQAKVQDECNPQLAAAFET